MLCDLTGGLDTRLLASAAAAAGLDFTVTVNGPPESEDVRIAHQIAEAMNWEIRHFDTRSFWTLEMTPDTRRELVYRTNGELLFTEVYHHLLSRPHLAKDFNLHMIGTGGDFYRTFPWEESFKMRYKTLASECPPPGLLSLDGLSCFYSRLIPRIKASNCQQLGAALTQQWDATFVWKMTSHVALYLSAVQSWLPSVAPMMSAGILKTATALPWRMRLGGQLQRQIIAHLSPRTAQVESWHSARRERRGTAEPGIKTVAAEMRRYTARLARAVERRLLRGIISRRLPSQAPVSLVTTAPLPFLTAEFRQFLDPKRMFSRAIYASDGLQLALEGDDADWRQKTSLIVRLANIEQLCRELEFEPQPDFWAPVLAG